MPISVCSLLTTDDDDDLQALEDIENRDFNSAYNAGRINPKTPNSTSICGSPRRDRFSREDDVSKNAKLLSNSLTSSTTTDAAAATARPSAVATTGTEAATHPFATQAGKVYASATVDSACASPFAALPQGGASVPSARLSERGKNGVATSATHWREEKHGSFFGSAQPAPHSFSANPPISTPPQLEMEAVKPWCDVLSAVQRPARAAGSGSASLSDAYSYPVFVGPTEADLSSPPPKNPQRAGLQQPEQHNNKPPASSSTAAAAAASRRGSAAALSDKAAEAAPPRAEPLPLPLPLPLPVGDEALPSEDRVSFSILRWLLQPAQLTLAFEVGHFRPAGAKI